MLPPDEVTTQGAGSCALCSARESGAPEGLPPGPDANTLPMTTDPVICAQTLLTSPQPVRFIDARVGPSARHDYLAGHLRGAVYADLNVDLAEVGDPAQGGRHPLPAMADWCERPGRWGIGPFQYCTAAGRRPWRSGW